MFQRNLRRAEVSLLKYLTGDVLVDARDFPIPFETQKIKDYLAPFITTKTSTTNFRLPDDYYNYQHLYKVGKRRSCDEGSSYIVGCDTPIPLLDKDVIDGRCNSYIKPLRPTASKPVARIIDSTIKFYPDNVGSVGLDYIRYPVFGEFKWKPDPVYKDDVYDPIASKDLEWGEWAREPLVWFIVNRYSTHIRENGLKQLHQLDKARG